MERPEREERALPAHPYRDSAIVYGVMAGILIVLAAVTGGSIVKATIAAIIFWLLACGWSWWKFRRRIRERELAAGSVVSEPRAESTEASVSAVVAGKNGVVSNGHRNGRGAGSGGGEP